MPHKHEYEQPKRRRRRQAYHWSSSLSLLPRDVAEADRRSFEFLLTSRMVCDDPDSYGHICAEPDGYAANLAGDPLGGPDERGVVGTLESRQ